MHISFSRDEHDQVWVVDGVEVCARARASEADRYIVLVVGVGFSLTFEFFPVPYRLLLLPHMKYMDLFSSSLTHRDHSVRQNARSIVRWRTDYTDSFSHGHIVTIQRDEHVSRYDWTQPIKHSNKLVSLRRPHQVRHRNRCACRSLKRRRIKMSMNLFDAHRSHRASIDSYWVVVNTTLGLVLVDAVTRSFDWKWNQVLCASELSESAD